MNRRAGGTVLLLCVAATLCAAASPGGDQSALDFPSGTSKNISDLYEGLWRTSDETSRSILKRLGFTKDSGAIIASVRSSKTDRDEIHLVKGEMDIASGNYTTSSKLRFEFQGVYSLTTRLLFVLLNPKEAIQVYNYSLVIDDMENIGKVLTDTFESSTSASFLRGHTNSTSAPVKSSTKQMDPESCTFKGLFYVSLADPELNYEAVWYEDQSPDKEVHNLVGRLRSLECHIEIEVSRLETMPLTRYSTQALRYVGVVAVASVWAILIMIRQMNYTSTTASVSRVSMLTVASQAIIDCFQCLTHLLIGLVADSVFNAFAALAFFNFVGFSIFELRYILLIWKARRPAQANGSWDSVRQDLSLLYLRFYGALVLVFVLLYYMSSLFNIFLFVAYSFWVPQVVSNVRRDASKPLLQSYILAMTVIRLLSPCYFYLIDPNFGKVEPNPSMVVVLVTWMAVQVGVLLLQDWLGPRFFIPNVFLPKQYDYLRPLPATLRTAGHTVECVICMSAVEPGQKHMISPCSHVFHRECLMRWVEFKMECPTCRRALPTPPANLVRQHQHANANGVPTDDGDIV